MSNKFVKGTTKVVKSLQRLDQDIVEAADNSIQQLGQEAVTEAQFQLALVANTVGFTQRYGLNLVDEIGLRKIPNGYEVAAPVRNTTKTVSENMYFAEYGAGTYGTRRTWRYPTTPADPSPIRELDSRSRVSGSRIPPYKYFSPKKGWIGVTNWSKPAHYMRRARIFIRRNWNKYFSRNINTAIYRYKK